MARCNGEAPRERNLRIIPCPGVLSVPIVCFSPPRYMFYDLYIPPRIKESASIHRDTHSAVLSGAQFNKHYKSNISTLSPFSIKLFMKNSCFTAGICPRPNEIV